MKTWLVGNLVVILGAFVWSFLSEAIRDLRQWRRNR